MRLASIIIGLALLLAPGAPSAEEKPYRVSLIGDSFDGRAWMTGLLIELDPGWKTYWRMPGESGVPPEFTWQSSVPAEIAVRFPAPARYADASGETVGYEGEALFPVVVDAGAAREVELTLDLFFAVCKDICIPATARASTVLGSVMRDPAGSARVEEAMRRVPAPGSAVTGAEIGLDGGKPVLRLRLAESVEDIFVETAGSAYFRKPVFFPDLEASLAIDNLKDTSKLSGATLRITYLLDGQAREQTLTLP